MDLVLPIPSGHLAFNEPFVYVLFESELSAILVWHSQESLTNRKK
jgi:hypothetical protein